MTMSAHQQINLEYWLKAWQAGERDLLTSFSSVNAKPQLVHRRCQETSPENKQPLGDRFLTVLCGLSFLLAKLGVVRQVITILPFASISGGKHVPVFPSGHGSKTCKESRNHLKEEITAASKHLAYDPERLQELYARQTGEDLHAKLYNLGVGMEGYNHYDPADAEKFDFFFYLHRKGDQRSMEVRAKRASEEFVSQLADSLLRILWLLDTDDSLTPESFSLQPANNQQEPISFNQTSYPISEKTLIDLFEETAQRTPSSIALTMEDQKWTFADLNQASNQLAHHLDEHKFGKGEIVAIAFPKSEWMIISILAILKTGAAYMPVDLDFPEERILFMLDDAGVRLVLTSRPDTPWGRQSLDPATISLKSMPASNLNYAVDTRSPAYVMYTSGSTGLPKGVVIEHQGAVNRIAWMWNHYKFTQADRILQKTTYVFDVSVWEIFMPLAYGAEMILCPPGASRNMLELASIIKEYGVTTIHFVPSVYDSFLQSVKKDSVNNLSSLRHVFVSGEALTDRLINRHRQSWQIPLHNLYGPTEASVDVSHWTATDEKPVLIGKPIWNTKLYILDEYNQLLPTQLVGQIGIAGVGLARGYINQVERTAERFKQNLVHDGEVVYLTGDIGRWTADGVEYLNRKDGQVKIRGFRIELGEVEQAVLSTPGIHQAMVGVVEMQESGKELMAIFQSRDSGLTVDTLISHLRRRLPEYMVPAYFRQVDDMRLTSNGKVDRSKMLTEGVTFVLAGHNSLRPANDLEKKILDCWKDVLSLSDIGVNVNFFSIGGTSLKVIDLHARIESLYPGGLAIYEMFSHNTIQRQGLLIAERANHVMQTNDVREIDF